MGNFSGSLGGHFTLHCDVWEIAVNTSANQSTVRCHVYITCDETTSGAYHLDNTCTWSASVNGNNRSGNFSYDFRNNANTKDLATYDTVVGHDANGNATIGWSASANMDNSPYITTAGVSGSLGLTHINRYANFTGFGVSGVNDQGLTVYASADVNCSAIEFSTDNGATWHNMGSGTSQQYIANNLRSGTSYNCKARLPRADNGLQTTSGVAAATTLLQNNFLAFL